MEKSGFVFNFESIIATQDRWPQLLDEIERGNVIPVIGPDLLVEPKVTEGNDGRIENLHQQIISFIASQTKVKSKPRTFSQLVYDDDYRYMVKNDRKAIYRLIYQIMNNLNDIKVINHEPSQLLMDLLGTKKFPFVITTSFAPIVENAMRDIWGDVKVINFTNDPQDCRPELGGDIQTENDLKQPTVMYMLGKYCDSLEKFAVTDSDMFEYCGSWIKGLGVSTNLKCTLERKHLLILGNDFSNWLNRLIWFALRRMTTTNMKSDYLVIEDSEDYFIQSVERLNTFYQVNTSLVIRRIITEWIDTTSNH